MARSLCAAIALVVLAFAPAVHGAPPPADVAITSCGQVIPKKTLGYLTGDLDCTGFTGGPANIGAQDAGAAVYIEKKGRLDLRGFTITGGQHGVVCDALICKANHLCSKGPCEVFNGTIVASAPYGHGISGYRPVVHDVTLTGHWMGVVAYNRLLLSDSTVTNGGSTGVMGRGLSITNTIITNHPQFGVDAYTDQGAVLRLTDSTVTGNGTAPFCVDYACADVASVRPPRLTNTTCNTSYSFSQGAWNVCALD